MIEIIFFIVFAVTAIGAALSLILQKNLVYSALSLILVIGSMGGLFLLLNAAFLAILQIVIYAGAIMTLFLFVIMMVDVKQEPAFEKVLRSRIALLALLLIAGGTIWGISTAIPTFDPLLHDFGFKALSRELYTTYLFPFEAIAVLILSSVIGALYIARKETP